METHIAKWGNSLAIRLPKAVVEAMHLKDREKISLRMEDDELVVSAKKKKPKPAYKKLYQRYSLEALLSQIKPEQLHESWDDGPAGKELL